MTFADDSGHKEEADRQSYRKMLRRNNIYAFALAFVFFSIFIVATDRATGELLMGCGIFLLLLGIALDLRDRGHQPMASA